jgi:hypothetical protein
MKHLSFIATALTVSALVGCANKPPKEEVAECKFLENPSEKAPTWACAPFTVDGFKDTGFGSYQKTGAGAQFAMDQAAAKARAQLANQVKARVSQMIRDYAGTTGSGATETVDRAASSTTQQITAETLTGSKVVRQAVDAKGNVYVLVGMDLEAANKRMGEALNTSMRNQPALWQQMQANRSQAEMQAEILKMGDRR